MKLKTKFTFIITALMLLLLFGCPNEGQNNDEPTQNTLLAGNDAPEDGYLRIHFNGQKAQAGDTTTWSVWAWNDFDLDAEQSARLAKGWPNGIPFTHCDDFGLYVDIKLKDKPEQVGIVVVDFVTEKKGSSDTDVTFQFPKKYKQIYIKNGSNKVYINAALTSEPKGLVSSEITAGNTVSIKVTGVTSVTADQFTVKDVNGEEIAITAASTTALTITNTAYISKAPYTITFDDGSHVIDTAVANISPILLDNEFAYNGDDLGWHNGVAKVWAPLASKAQILIYDSIADAETDFNAKEPKKATPVDMTSAGSGVWQADVPEGKYYMYYLTNSGKTYKVCDIYATVCSPDSIAAKAVELDNNWGETSYVNPWGNNGTETKSYKEAVIFEMHIRDWSKGINASNKGKFDDITAGLGTNGDGVFGQHLKDLGITHVQILPMFDYAEKNSDDEYNWGYNPYQYNVPEGRYVNNHEEDGMNAVTQMRNMIKAFHDAGIAVNMDVVYNHTNGTLEGSLFDMTVPKYYYRLSADGSYSSGSGCGNEMASNSAMYHKFMIDSLKHWVNDYHINGFRFDLMGLHEQSTMKDIYNALKQLDKNIMVYGEPWTGGNSPVVNGVNDKKHIDKCADNTSDNYVGCFNDDYRNAIKGAEFGGFQQGHVQGIFSPNVHTGLLGTMSFTKNNGRSLSYVECHDNYTLADKLAISLNKGTSKAGWKSYDSFTADQQTVLRNENKLAAAFVFLSQGTPFINGGQEFMRTKQGDENSYKSNDSINAIDMSFKIKYKDVYDTYKGLIAFRKANASLFVSPTAKDAGWVRDENSKAILGLSYYIVEGASAAYKIYLNATDTEQTIDTTGYSKVVDVTSGTPEDKTLTTKVGAKGFVILKK